MIQVKLTVNGRARSFETEPQRTLLWALREQLELRGAKEGCGEGECGACTVLLDGKPVTSCIVLAASAEGAEVTTIEGLATDGVLDPVQEMFIEHGAVQCGYCIPGMILSARALLDRDNSPTDEQIRVALAGNFCRCTGYTKIIDAVRAAAAIEAQSA